MGLHNNMAAQPREGCPEVATAARSNSVRDLERRALPFGKKTRYAKEGPQGPTEVVEEVAPLLGSKSVADLDGPRLLWKRNGQDARRHPQHPPQISEEVDPSEGRKSSVYMGLFNCFYAQFI